MSQTSRSSPGNHERNSKQHVSAHQAVVVRAKQDQAEHNTENQRSNLVSDAEEVIFRLRGGNSSLQAQGTTRQVQTSQELSRL